MFLLVHVSESLCISPLSARNHKGNHKISCPCVFPLALAVLPTELAAGFLALQASETRLRMFQRAWVRKGSPIRERGREYLSTSRKEIPLVQAETAQAWQLHGIREDVDCAGQAE